MKSNKCQKEFLYYIYLCYSSVQQSVVNSTIPSYKTGNNGNKEYRSKHKASNTCVLIPHSFVRRSEALNGYINTCMGWNAVPVVVKSNMCNKKSILFKEVPYPVLVFRLLLCYFGQWSTAVSSQLINTTGGKTKPTFHYRKKDIQLAAKKEATLLHKSFRR